MSLTKITQYGWPTDPDADSLTEAKIGEWDNTLNADGCALTVAQEKLLGWTNENNLQWVIITWPNGHSLKRQWQDRAPEGDPRVDLYMPQGFSNEIDGWGDFATVTAA